MPEPITMTIAGTVLATKAIETAVEKLTESGVELTIDGIKQIFRKNGKEINDTDAEKVVHHYAQTNIQHNTDIQGDSIGTKADTTTTIEGDQLNDNARKIITTTYIENNYQTEENTPKKS